ncbi:MAG: flagellar basal body-associated FliL family protein [Lachnospiraceae bacterium]|nr:flagellar basal body-associated FliL family protein [Lachnospiraceae bacterium]
MKKNIFTIIILALVTVNVILTAVIMFSTMPAMKRTTNLVQEISQMVDLELEDKNGDGTQTVSVKDKEIHTFKSSKEETITVNLAKGEDGKTHYALLDAVYVTVNSSADDYKDLVEILDTKGSNVVSIVTDIIGNYSYEKITSEKTEMKEKVVEELQTFFESKSIVDVSFDNLRFQ